ncbi:MAG: AAA family ATPase [Anaerolineae bacterium]|nr:AAA family ATPase [Anaerolineae bacterium]
MAYLNVRLLGSFQATQRGQDAINFETTKARALLAYLAVEAERPHQREALAEMLWPDRPEGAARSNLRHTLAGLRRAIGDRDADPPFLYVTRQTIQLNGSSDIWLDAAEFEALVVRGMAVGYRNVRQLEEAVGLYRGAFLEDVQIGDSAAFEEWVLLKREQYSRQVSGVLDRLAEWYTWLGDYERALLYARQRVALEPWDEKRQRQVMRLLAYSDRRGAALAQYEACRRTLEEELGAEPEERTTLLYERIRDEMLDAPSPAPGFLYVQERGFEGKPALFVAREGELARLRGFLDLALGGQGQVVFVSGEAGSGKTALVQAFARTAQVAHPELVVAGGNGVAYTGLGDPYHPFREVLELLGGAAEARWRAGGMTADHACRLWNMLPLTAQALVEVGPDLVDSFVGGKGLLERARACGPAEAGWLGGLEELLERKAAAPAGAGTQQSALFGQVTRVVQSLAQQAPLLLILDDLQWMDIGSISLLFHLGRQLEGSRILIVGAYRPAEVVLGLPRPELRAQSGASKQPERHPLASLINEFKRRFGDIEIDLSQAEGRQFVETFIDAHPNRLSALFRETLFEQTRGHPLFTVELFHGLQERGDLVKDTQGRWVEGTRVDWKTLPTRVEAVIAERIARLPQPLQQVLRVAGVEGETFTAEVAARALAVEDREIVARMSGELDKVHHLIRAEGIHCLGAEPATTGRCLSRYRFRHILFQTYLYSTLDPVERPHLHEAVGTALEALFGDSESEIATIAPQLALHFQRAGDINKATDYLLQAGKRATRMSAAEEAIAHFTQGLALLEPLPDTPERARRELALQIGLMAPLLMAADRPVALEVAQAHIRAWELFQKAEDTGPFLPDLFYLAQFYSSHGDHRMADKITRHLADRAESDGNVSLTLMAHSVRGWNCFLRGELDSARTHLERAIACAGLQASSPLVPFYRSNLIVPDPHVLTLGYLTLLMWELGYPEQALKRSREAIGLAHKVGRFQDLLGAYCLTGVFFMVCRDIQMAHEYGENLVHLAAEHRVAYWEAAGHCVYGWTLAMQGQDKAGIAQMRQGVAEGRAIEAWLTHPCFATHLAQVYGRIGQVEEGIALLDEALTMAHRNGERWMDTEIHRLKGDLLLAQGASVADIEHNYRQAIELARQRGARSRQLRATTSLCRLWQQPGKREEARRLLAEIYNWFTEGFDTPDLQEARVLLEGLG